MKKGNSQQLLFFLFSFMLHGVFSYSQTKYWMQKAGGLTPDEGIDIAIDLNGNTYTTGYFSSAVNFGIITLTSSGVTDVFITKVDNLGNFQWAVKGGGAGVDKGLAIKTDAFGNSYVTGFFYGIATFGNQTVTAAGVQDVFIAKYDAMGVLLWLRRAGGSDADIANGITIDNAGNVFITGEFKGTANFGSLAITSMNNSVDVFTAKLDFNGNFLWVKKGSAHLTDRGIDIGCDSSGNSYVIGQFTDTITFDFTHNNNLYNSIFLIKYNSNGQEQWFRKIGGGTSNIAYGIAVDQNSNIYLTGDFTGNINFYGTSNTTLTNAFYNRIFIAKYDTWGTLLWAEADGSSSEVNSRNITLDTSGNAYLVGNFKCRFSEYSNRYGQGTFNSIGFKDIFVSKYNANGAWQWSRQCGGRRDDYGSGVAVNNWEQIYIAGSFFQEIRFAVSADYIGYNSSPVYNGTNAFCNDNYYNKFEYFNSAGNSDIIIAKNFDPVREAYDYYIRNNAGCDRPYLGVCINKDNTNNCPDSVTFCGSGYLYGNPKTTPAGPEFNYLWSNGATVNPVPVYTSGYYSVVQTSSDGCFVSRDSIYVIVNPLPQRPTISDDHGINTNAINTSPIVLCNLDSVLLTGGNFGTNAHGWGVINGTTTIWAKTAGLYFFKTVDSNGCTSSNSVEVIVEKNFDPIIPKMICIEDPDKNDSVSLCGGKTFSMFVYDSISNPAGNFGCFSSAQVTWSALPNTLGYPPIATCSNSFTPTQSGTYLISATIVRKNNCDTDTMVISKSIYITLLPAPLDTITVSITGNKPLCPGDSLLLIGNSSINVYSWWGEGVWSNTNDSVWVKKEGIYYLYSPRTKTNSYGCSLTTIGTASVYVSYKPQPVVTMNPGNGLICPNDSVQLQCNGSGTFEWQGPSGPVGNTSSLYVKIPGFYYCIYTDADGCKLVSNTVEITQYATPLLLASPNTSFCSGDSIIISAIANAGSTIQWQLPLTGNSTTQFITTSGTYSCLITSCGIPTMTSVTVTASDLIIPITVSGPLTFCEGDSVLLSASGNLSSYNWQPGNYNQPQITVYQSGTYTLSTMDNYGCTATGIPVTVTAVPNNLSAPVCKDTAICPGNSAILIATGPGTIQWYDLPKNGTLLNSGVTFITPNLTTTTVYYVVTTDSICKSPPSQVNVYMDNCDDIIPPNIFSPNGDGSNDVFYFPIKEGKCFNCKIYNRWGTLIYEWDDLYKGWNGTNQKNGKIVPDGVYYYILEYCNFIDAKKTQTGFVQLLTRE